MTIISQVWSFFLFLFSPPTQDVSMRGSQEPLFVFMAISQKRAGSRGGSLLRAKEEMKEVKEMSEELSK